MEGKNRFNKGALEKYSFVLENEFNYAGQICFNTKILSLEKVTEIKRIM